MNKWDKVSGKRVVVVGVGNIGSHLVPHLGRFPGIGRVTLIDPDLQYVRYIYVLNGSRPGPEMSWRLPGFGIV